ncbi:hypothetical protein CSA17_01520 [bacterium DOLJORAL78_65_58]|nr:MAG: hypothetical protein CSB20_04540 [bacterium DOLZORAL124_64_63]PIE76577.1 MAG: hypothetical protein CSA17_01520 [bacterium DOLJORAL78_65_58]
MNPNGPFDPQREAHLLSAYVDGELDAENIARVEAHLARDEDARREVERLRRLNRITGSLRLKEAPPEEWEGFWRRFPNRAERHLGWFLLSIGVVLVGGWLLLRLLGTLIRSGMPLFLKGGIFMIAAGVLVLLFSVVRERIYVRSHTRYKDVIR